MTCAAQSPPTESIAEDAEVSEGREARFSYLAQPDGLRDRVPFDDKAPSMYHSG